jgi:hypothetical protein
MHTKLSQIIISSRERGATLKRTNRVKRAMRKRRAIGPS